MTVYPLFYFPLGEVSVVQKMFKNACVVVFYGQVTYIEAFPNRTRVHIANHNPITFEGNEGKQIVPDIQALSFFKAGDIYFNPAKISAVELLGPTMKIYMEGESGYLTLTTDAVNALAGYIASVAEAGTRAPLPTLETETPAKKSQKKRKE